MIIEFYFVMSIARGPMQVDVRFVRMLVLGGLCAIAWPAHAQPNRAQHSATQKLLNQKKAANQALKESQARIDKDSDKTLSMLDEYRAIQESLIAVRAQNAQLARSLEQQNQELASLDSQIAEVSTVRVKLSPLLTRMVSALDEFVRLDLPFLKKERDARSQALHALLQEGREPVATQARRVFEAYLVELGYGQTLEAYEDTIEIEGQALAVELLRVGRVGLYYLSVDGERAGRFNPVSKTFEALESSEVPKIRQALLVAKKRVPPQLISIPLAQTPRKEGVRS